MLTYWLATFHTRAVWHASTLQTRPHELLVEFKWEKLFTPQASLTFKRVIKKSERFVRYFTLKIDLENQIYTLNFWAKNYCQKNFFSQNSSLYILALPQYFSSTFVFYSCEFFINMSCGWHHADVWKKWKMLLWKVWHPNLPRFASALRATQG